MCREFTLSSDNTIPFYTQTDLRVYNRIRYGLPWLAARRWAAPSLWAAPSRASPTKPDKNTSITAPKWRWCFLRCTTTRASGPNRTPWPASSISASPRGFVAARRWTRFRSETPRTAKCVYISHLMQFEKGWVFRQSERKYDCVKNKPFL